MDRRTTEPTEGSLGRVAREDGLTSIRSAHPGIEILHLYTLLPPEEPMEGTNFHKMIEDDR